MSAKGAVPRATATKTKNRGGVCSNCGGPCDSAEGTLRYTRGDARICRACTPEAPGVCEHCGTTPTAGYRDLDGAVRPGICELCGTEIGEGFSADHIRKFIWAYVCTWTAEHGLDAPVPAPAGMLRELVDEENVPDWCDDVVASWPSVEKKHRADLAKAAH